jgi:hypothetical protein
MAAELIREIVIEAVLNEPYDGASRLLGDAQRFGFELRTFALAVGTNGTASVTITLGVSTSIDAQVVTARLARHPAVQRMDVWVDAGRALLDCPQAVAA